MIKKKTNSAQGVKILLLNFLLICVLTITFFVGKSGMKELREIRAVSSGQRSVFSLRDKLQQKVTVKHERNATTENRSYKLVDNNTEQGRGYSTSSSNLSYSDNSEDRISVPYINNHSHVTKNNNRDRSFVREKPVINTRLSIIGLGYDLAAAQKAVAISKDAILGFSFMDKKHLEIVRNVPNPIFAYVPIRYGDDRNDPGLHSGLSVEENVIRLSAILESFERVDGLFLDGKDMIAGGRNVASAIFRVAKNLNLDILNLGEPIDDNIVNRLRESSIVLMNYSCDYSTAIKGDCLQDSRERVINFSVSTDALKALNLFSGAMYR